MAVVLDPGGTMEIIFGDLVSLAAFLTVLPLFLYVTFSGKLPDALVGKLSDSLFEDLAKAETLFTRFNVRSVVAAVVVLILACYSLMS